MARSSRRRLAITVVVGLGVVDAVGIYLVQHKLGKPVEIGAREMAIANAPLAEPIAIRANGALKPTPALAVSAVAPRPAPAPEAQRTARVDLPAPARAVAAVAIPATRRQARQTAPVAIGQLADVEKPVVRAMAPRRSAAAGQRAEDLRIHEQRIPARAVRVERMPAQADAFSAAFAGSGEELRLPEPAYGALETQPQASVELPALELSVSQIQTDPAAAPETEIPAAPPATATGSDEVQPKS